MASPIIPSFYLGSTEVHLYSDENYQKLDPKEKEAVLDVKSGDEVLHVSRKDLKDAVFVIKQENSLFDFIAHIKTWWTLRGDKPKTFEFLRGLGQLKSNEKGEPIKSFHELALKVKSAVVKHFKPSSGGDEIEQNLSTFQPISPATATVSFNFRKGSSVVTPKLYENDLRRDQVQQKTQNLSSTNKDQDKSGTDIHLNRTQEKDEFDFCRDMNVSDLNDKIKNLDEEIGKTEFPLIKVRLQAIRKKLQESLDKRQKEQNQVRSLLDTSENAPRDRAVHKTDRVDYSEEEQTNITFNPEGLKEILDEFPQNLNARIGDDFWSDAGKQNLDESTAAVTSSVGGDPSFVRPKSNESDLQVDQVQQQTPSLSQDKLEHVSPRLEPLSIEDERALGMLDEAVKRVIESGRMITKEKENSPFQQLNRMVEKFVLSLWRTPQEQRGAMIQSAEKELRKYLGPSFDNALAAVKQKQALQELEGAAQKQITGSLSITPHASWFEVTNNAFQEMKKAANGSGFRARSAFMSTGSAMQEYDQHSRVLEDMLKAKTASQSELAEAMELYKDAFNSLENIVKKKEGLKTFGGAFHEATKKGSDISELTKKGVFGAESYVPLDLELRNQLEKAVSGEVTDPQKLDALIGDLLNVLEAELVVRNPKNKTVFSQIERAMDQLYLIRASFNKSQKNESNPRLERFSKRFSPEFVIAFNKRVAELEDAKSKVFDDTFKEYQAEINQLFEKHQVGERKALSKELGRETGSLIREEVASRKSFNEAESLGRSAVRRIDVKKAALEMRGSVARLREWAVDLQENLQEAGDSSPVGEFVSSTPEQLLHKDAQSLLSSCAQGFEMLKSGELPREKLKAISSLEEAYKASAINRGMLGRLSEEESVQQERDIRDAFTIQLSALKKELILAAEYEDNCLEELVSKGHSLIKELKKEAQLEAYSLRGSADAAGLIKEMERLLEEEPEAYSSLEKQLTLISAYPELKEIVDKSGFRNALRVYEKAVVLTDIDPTKLAQEQVLSDLKKVAGALGYTSFESKTLEEMVQDFVTPENEKKIRNSEDEALIRAYENIFVYDEHSVLVAKDFSKALNKMAEMLGQDQIDETKEAPYVEGCIEYALELLKPDSVVTAYPEGMNKERGEALKEAYTEVADFVLKNQDLYYPEEVVIDRSDFNETVRLAVELFDPNKE